MEQHDPREVEPEGITDPGYAPGGPGIAAVADRSDEIGSAPDVENHRSECRGQGDDPDWRGSVGQPEGDGAQNGTEEHPGQRPTAFQGPIPQPRAALPVRIRGSTRPT